MDATWNLIMMCHSGKERTELQWHELLGSVGLRVRKIWPSQGEKGLLRGSSSR